MWLATHSLEAVEAAGQRATFVLERNDSNRKVDSISRLDERPVLSALSRAVGTPAFSISRLAFVFIEGEENIGERERFRQLSDCPRMYGSSNAVPVMKLCVEWTCSNRWATKHRKRFE